MECKPDDALHDKDENRIREEQDVPCFSKFDGEYVLKSFSSSPHSKVQVNAVDGKGGKDIAYHELSGDLEAYREVNMEASITPDDVVRAGGYGARDDISSFLPVASDSTDFEATIRDARDYEELQGDMSRQGLGWKKS